MKILVAHNYYRQKAGEDFVFENELTALRSMGHVVKTVAVTNAAIRRSSLLKAVRTVANPVGIAAMRLAIDEFQPDVAHVHNFFPLLSPAIYGVCRKAGVPVVQTLHNYRPLCSSALLFRNNGICEVCVNGSPIWGVVHRCYRNSVFQSAAAAWMVAAHRARKTWLTDVDRYIALSEFGRNLFAAAGFPADRIDVKPNFTEDPGSPSEALPRAGVLYVGRLSVEKGIRTLVEACAKGGYPLRLVGTGPELANLALAKHKNIAIVGNQTKEAVIEEMRRAAIMVVPSIWYEPCPLVVIEAMACATPVIASDIGGLPELVAHGDTGIVVPAGDAAALAAQIGRMLGNPDERRRMGKTARETFLRKYTREVTQRKLEQIYHRAIAGMAVASSRDVQAGGPKS